MLPKETLPFDTEFYAIFFIFWRQIPSLYVQSLWTKLGLPTTKQEQLWWTHSTALQSWKCLRIKNFQNFQCWHYVDFLSVGVKLLLARWLAISQELTQRVCPGNNAMTFRNCPGIRHWPNKAVHLKEKFRRQPQKYIKTTCPCWRQICSCIILLLQHFLDRSLIFCMLT